MARVVIVDSHPAIRKWLNASLGKIGHQVDQATDGKTALETASREPIDLMLVAVDLPRMSGCQVLFNLKGNPRTRAIPVIMLTSIQSYETEAECLRLGASNVVTKPCSFDDLATHIRVALREGQETVGGKTKRWGATGSGRVGTANGRSPAERSAGPKIIRTTQQVC